MPSSEVDVQNGEKERPSRKQSHELCRTMGLGSYHWQKKGRLTKRNYLFQNRANLHLSSSISEVLESGDCSVLGILRFWMEMLP